MTRVTAADLQASFRGEIYGDAAAMTEAWFDDHVTRNAVDLTRSPRWTVAGELSGAALLAFRGERAWVGAFGVVPAFRGRGLARRYLAETLAIAREAGAATLELEVMAHNAYAVALYRRGGFETVGELVAWTRDASAAGPSDGDGSDVPVQSMLAYEPRRYTVDEVAALARRPATCWQREPESVAAASPSALVIAGDAGAWRAYAFVRRTATARASVLDAGSLAHRHANVAASDGESEIAVTTALFGELDRRFPSHALTLLNEPPHGAVHAALTASPAWRESVRQYRMRATL